MDLTRCEKTVLINLFTNEQADLKTISHLTDFSTKSILSAVHKLSKMDFIIIETEKKNKFRIKISEKGKVLAKDMSYDQQNKIKMTFANATQKEIISRILDIEKPNKLEILLHLIKSDVKLTGDFPKDFDIELEIIQKKIGEKIGRQK